jgi:two-component system, sensor histidine kinase and response regulator
VRLLLVEDDEDDYVITRDLLGDLEQTEYLIDWVTNTKDAFTQLQVNQQNYDVCLLDYRLGNDTGLDFLRKTAAANITVPMILLTEHTDRQIDLSAMQEGASDFLVKSELNTTNLDRVIRYVRSVRKHEQERLQLALALEARKHADAVNKSKDDFLGMVSHELRGPINAVLLWTELLKSQETTAELKLTAIETIERSIRQQSKLLDDLIELTRGINNMIQLNRHTVNLADIIQETVAMFNPSAQQKSLTIRLKTAGDSFFLVADPDRLTQIFSNLISNSIKFTAANGQITIQLKSCQFKDGAGVVVSITDTGKGISSELLPHVFTRYLQAYEHRKNNVGLGLGLTIAKQLVELHEGTIYAESSGESQGSTFTVTLPLQIPQHAER